MGKNRKRIAVILDANVVISSLIKYGGHTARVLRISSRLFDTYVPEMLVTEVLKHADLIARKACLTREDVELALKILLKRVKLVSLDKKLLGPALEYVTDRKDAYYVSLGLRLLSRYSEIILLTYNKKDFNVGKLKERNIHILTPVEFISWLRENVA